MMLSISPITIHATNPMADPARYHIDPYLVGESATLYVERAAGGAWVKWADFEDYKAAQRRNKNEETVRQLGMEIVELRSRLAELEQFAPLLDKPKR